MPQLVNAANFTALKIKAVYHKPAKGGKQYSCTSMELEKSSKKLIGMGIATIIVKSTFENALRV